jgi:hypothetical protein
MRYGWIVLLISAILGLLAALLITISPTTVLFGPEFRAGNVPGALRAWGIIWLFFNVFALVVLFRGFRQGERWAWWTLWLLPLLWLSYFVFDPSTVHNLVIAVITAVGLISSYRTFFPASGQQPSRVS